MSPSPLSPYPCVIVLITRKLGTLKSHPTSGVSCSESSFKSNNLIYLLMWFGKKSRSSSMPQKSWSLWTFGTACRPKNFYESFSKLSWHKIVNDKVDWGIQKGGVVYREKKQKFSLTHKLANRWRTTFKTFLTFLTPLLIIREGITGYRKITRSANF